MDHSQSRSVAPDQREEAFRLLVEAVTEYAIFRLDPDGYIISWNQGAQQIKGYRTAKILGRHVSTFYTEEATAAKRPEEALAAAARDGSWTGEGWRLRKSGERFWAHVTITALYGDDGELRGFVKVTRDMTERKQRAEELENERRRYRRLFEESRDAIILTTPDGVVLDANSAAERLFGYARAELLRKNARRLYADPAERMRRIVPAITKTRGSVVLETRMRRKDGRTFLASASVTVHHDEAGQPELIQALVRDVTEQRRLQRNILQVQEEERRRLGQDLHDGVASQLTGIGIMLNLLARRAEEDSAAGHELVDEIQEIRTLVGESCQDVRRLSRGLAPAGLSREELAGALERLAQNVEGGQFDEGADLPELDDDTAAHLYWIAQEAIANARRYAEADRIAIRLQRTEAGDLLLEVEDDGQGFNIDGVEDGSLGLHTMRYRAELLGAQLTIDSALDEGTRIACRLPK